MRREKNVGEGLFPLPLQRTRPQKPRERDVRCATTGGDKPRPCER